MDKLRETARQLLDEIDTSNPPTVREKTITAMREALAEQAEQEPVFRCANCECIYSEKVTQCDCMPDVQEWIEGTMSFNAAPVRTKDLTDEEIEDVCCRLWSGGWRKKAMNDFARAVIAKFKEKNRG